MVGEARYGLGSALDERQHRRRQRHADRPLHRHARSPASIIGNAGKFPIHRDQTDHQFVYNLTAQAVPDATRSRPASTSAARRSTTSPTTSRAASGPSTRSAAASPTPRRTPRSSTAASASSRRATVRSSSRTGMNEANLYAQDDWRVTRCAHAEPRPALRVRRARRARSEDRIDYIFGADNEQHRAAPRRRLRAELGERVPRRSSSGGPGSIAFHAGYGIYDGRIFQSVFSQSGANVRFNPPNALSPHDYDAAEHPECLGSDARLRVRARSADRRVRR